jgi:hypothetical protein
LELLGAPLELLGAPQLLVCCLVGMSRMKRLALVVLCHTVTDRHIMRLKVGA